MDNKTEYRKQNTEYRKQETEERRPLVFTIFDGEVINLQIFAFSASIGVHLRLMKLKKQTQFVVGPIGVNYYLKGIYDKIALCGTRKNKAKQSQLVRSECYVLRSAKRI